MNSGKKCETYWQMCMESDKRLKRRNLTGEVFTPDSLLDKMTATLSDGCWSDSNNVFLDNSCGNGNILLYIIKKKLDNGSTYLEAIKTVYGVDLMPDNIEECYERIKALLNERNIKYDESEVDTILKHNIVCHDALDWDYENWKPKPNNTTPPLF